MGINGIKLIMKMDKRYYKYIMLKMGLKNKKFVMKMDKRYQK